MACNVEVEIADKLNHNCGPASGTTRRRSQGLGATHRGNRRRSLSYLSLEGAATGSQAPDRRSSVTFTIRKSRSSTISSGSRITLAFSNRFQETQMSYCPWDQAFSKYTLSATRLKEIPSLIRRDGCSRFRSAMTCAGTRDRKSTTAG